MDRTNANGFVETEQGQALACVTHSLVRGSLVLLLGDLATLYPSLSEGSPSGLREDA